MPPKAGILEQKNKKSAHAWWLDNEMIIRERGLYGKIKITGFGEYFFRASFPLDRINNDISSRLSRKLDRSEPQIFDYAGCEHLLWY